MITFRIRPAVEAYCFKAVYILGPYAGGDARGNGAVDLLADPACALLHLADVSALVAAVNIPEPERFCGRPFGNERMNTFSKECRWLPLRYTVEKLLEPRRESIFMPNTTRYPVKKITEAVSACIEGRADMIFS